jgi:hypothetical protein
LYFAQVQPNLKDLKELRKHFHKTLYRKLDRSILKIKYLNKSEKLPAQHLQVPFTQVPELQEFMVHRFCCCLFTMSRSELSGEEKVKEISQKRNDKNTKKTIPLAVIVREEIKTQLTSST